MVILHIVCLMFVITRLAEVKPLDDLKDIVTLFFKFLCLNTQKLQLKARHTEKISEICTEDICITQRHCEERCKFILGFISKFARRLVSLNRWLPLLCP